MKNMVLILLLSINSQFAFSNNEKVVLKETDAITKLLQDRTNGNNAFYNKALSPGQSLDVSKNKADRIQDVNNQIINEIDSILTTFKSNTEDKKVDAVYGVVKNFESKVIENSGAYVTFIDAVPSAANSRTLLMIPKNGKTTSQQVMDALTSYKRSAKPNDYIFEYESAQNLTQGSIKQTQGSDTTWKTPEAAAPLIFDQDTVIKKCRKVLGWRCVTSLYKADSLLTGADNVKVLFIAIYDLVNNPDHPDFAKDKRSTNQITGSTAVYIVKESANWILLYGTDIQWNDGKLSFQDSIQNEFQKDYNRFKERMSLDTAVSVSELK